MKLLRALTNPARPLADALKLEIQLGMLLMRFPTLRVQRPSHWHFDTLRAIELGENVSVGAFTEIIAYSRSPKTPVAGKLILGHRSTISAGCNIRAAGGVIRIGDDSGIGQGCILIAANHRIGDDMIRSGWETERIGVTVGANCWVGAGCVLLPGTTIGDGAVIAAGSVVSKSVPAHEVWAGVPARLLRTIPAAP